MGSSTATYYANEFDSSGKLITGIIVAGTISTAYLNQDVALPALGIHHQQDSCEVTPVSATSRIINGRSPKYISKLEIIDGGISEGGVCESFAYHGFNQTEPELVKRAAQFILEKKQVNLSEFTDQLESSINQSTTSIQIRCKRSMRTMCSWIFYLLMESL